MTTEQEIERGAALAFFACAFADQADECDSPLRGEIMDQLPTEIDPAALHAARTLMSDVTRKLGTPDELYTFNAGGLSPKDWGHCLAMQAMGHGVGLWEYGVRLNVPRVEFGSYSLARDYFQPAEE